MNVPLTDDLTRFVREKVQSGEFPSEAAVVEEALNCLRKNETRVPRDFVDQEFVDYCAREGDPQVSLEDVLRTTSTISGSMADAVIDERAKRF